MVFVNKKLDDLSPYLDVMNVDEYIYFKNFYSNYLKINSHYRRIKNNSDLIRLFVKENDVPDLFIKWNRKLMLIAL